MRRSFLVVIGDREPLAWVLDRQRMAFPVQRRRAVAAASPGDQLLLYTTRGAFRNPGRDAGRVIAEATLASPVSELKEPVRFGDREFALGCDIELHSLAPLLRGVELAPLVPELSTFTNKTAWPARLRRPLVALTSEDAELLAAALADVAGPVAVSLPQYRAAGRGSVRR